MLRCTVSSAARHGTLDFAQLREVTAALRAPEPDVGAVLLAGEGPHFCVGADVGALAAAGSGSWRIRVRPCGRSRASCTSSCARVVEVPLPVVAAVRGWAAGAGMSLVVAADVAVAGVSTRLRPAYPAIGLSPDGGLTWTLPRAVGAARARHILLTDRVLDAAEALALGLVATVVPDDEVAEQALALAQRLADGPDPGAGPDEAAAAGGGPRPRRAARRGGGRDRRVGGGPGGPGGHRRVPRAPPAAVPVGPELSERGVR